MLKIAPDVQYLSRAEWGADTDLPRLGTTYPADEPTEAIQHHTVIIDNDATPNRWETAAEVIVKMRQLQTIRPDLGLDVPYSYVAFPMKYTHKIGLILCEGRGPYRRGAHTMYHNRTGRATAIEGNTEIGVPLDEYVGMMSYAWGWIKDEHGLVNLGSVRPERGGVVFGHTDFRREDDRRTWTVCPGENMMAVIDQLTLTRYQEESDMTNWKLMIDTAGDTWLVERVEGFPYSKRLIAHQVGRDYLATLPALNPPQKVGDPGEYTQGQFDTIPIIS